MRDFVAGFCGLYRFWFFVVVCIDRLLWMFIQACLGLLVLLYLSYCFRCFRFLVVF